MRKQWVTLAALLMLPVAAQAVDGGGHLDIYFVPSAKLDVTVPGSGSGSDDGTGFGIKGLGRGAGSQIAFTGEFQSTDYDDSDISLDQLRLGVGLAGATTSGIYLEYINLDIDSSKATGFGLHGRLAGENLYGQFGFVSVEDDFETNSGVEFVVGAAFGSSGNVGGFVDLRKTMLEGEDSNIELEFTDIRAGVRFKF